MVSACATTWAQSAICGSARGDTNEPTSISRNPGPRQRRDPAVLAGRRHDALDALQAVARADLAHQYVHAGSVFVEGHHGLARERGPGCSGLRLHRPQTAYFSLVSAGSNHCRACTFFIWTGSMNGNTVLLKAK